MPILTYGCLSLQIFGCNINYFSLTEGCPLSLWTTAVQNSPKTPHRKSTCLEHILDKAHLSPPPPLPHPDTAINRKNGLMLIMTPEKQDKTLELSKH